MTVAREAITGLVLAGGRGARMGGADKGLVLLNGVPLARHALQRLRPQVDALMISANRHLDAYRALGVPVVSDNPPQFDGPLAGVLAGLEACATPWLACVPCDAPAFPLDLVARLHQAALSQRCDAAMAASLRDGAKSHQASPELSLEPSFCLLRASLAPTLRAALASGERRFQGWLKSVGAAQVVFSTDAAALSPFANLNTPEELGQAEAVLRQ